MGKEKEKKGKPGVMLCFEMLPVMEELSPSGQLSLYNAIIQYAYNGQEPELKKEARIAWKLIRPIIDRDDERYRRTVEARRKAGKVRGKQMKQEAEERKQEESEHLLNLMNTESQSSISNLQTSIVSRQSSVSNLCGETEVPTLEQVRQFCMAEGLETNANDFYEYYASMGWKLSGGPVRDWKTLARRWHRKAQEQQKEKPSYGKYGIVL